MILSERRKQYMSEETINVIDEIVENLKAAVPLHDGNAYEQGYHAALEDVKSYGRPVEHE